MNVTRLDSNERWHLHGLHRQLHMYSVPLEYRRLGSLQYSATKSYLHLHLYHGRAAGLVVAAIKHTPEVNVHALVPR